MDNALPKQILKGNMSRGSVDYPYEVFEYADKMREVRLALPDSRLVTTKYDPELTELRTVLEWLIKEQ